MNNLMITKILTNNGVPIAYELSNGHQITIENASEFFSKEELNSLSLKNLPFENINKPSD